MGSAVTKWGEAFISWQLFAHVINKMESGDLHARGKSIAIREINTVGCPQNVEIKTFQAHS